MTMLKSALKNQTDLVHSVKLFMIASTGKMKLNLETIKIKGIVEDCVHTMQEKAALKRIRFVVEMDELVSMQADAAALKNCVLLNMLSNAVKFSNEGGTIHIRSWLDPSLQVVTIEVQDNGIGMSPQKLAAIQNDCGETTTVGTMGESGSGFGVPILRSVSQLFHGEVTIRSVLQTEEHSDHGTTVRVVFPMACN